MSKTYATSAGVALIVTLILFSCKKVQNTTDMEQTKPVTAEMILGNPDYMAISYGGYRQSTRDIQPTLEQLKEDMRLLSAMGVKILRTYNVQLAHASNVLRAIRELKEERSDFEMYVMLGAWIDCKDAWTDRAPDHEVESPKNATEIARAIELTNEYADIVKVLAVGNEAMVKWATAYYVQPGVILKWVNHLQDLKKRGGLPSDLWITSSDNFASWGGGGEEYHVADLDRLIKSVDFISMHTYPMHDTHYNPQFWGIREEESGLNRQEQIEKVMERALDYAKQQFAQVKKYRDQLGVDIPIHIGETGWASQDNHLYGEEGSRATDEYKAAVYYRMMRQWTQQEGISCFYFEAFDEPWKDAKNSGGSENHFGLFTVEGLAKKAIWPLVDEGVFEGLTRGGNPIRKTYENGDQGLLEGTPIPALMTE